LGLVQGRLRLKGLFALGSIALTLGYVVPTVGVAAGPAVPVAATLAASADVPAPAGSLRRLRYAGDARVFEGRLVTFSERQRRETVGLPFASRQVSDAALTAGTTVVDAAGVAGTHTQVFEEQLVDGLLVDTTLLADITVQPADRVVRMGSKASPPEPLPFDPTVNYQQAIAGSATSYCLTGHTATGSLAGPGSIAVDPTVIKLGSHLYVPGYGYGYAVDTGGVIKGTLIDVWLTCDAAIQWGRRQLTIYVLAN
jgi:3D (Asp-Asp-Asp) domain-containing protein